MLTWLIKRQINAFETKYAYDMSYVRHMLSVDPSAVWRLSKIDALKSYRKEVPSDAHLAAALTGTLIADCGPCAQLMVSMALDEGMAPQCVAAVVSGDATAMTDPVRLASQFARASLTHAAEAEALRAEVVERWGERGLISLAFALVTSQIYPTLKYALGHGAACQKVVIQGATVEKTESTLRADGPVHSLRTEPAP